MVVDGAQYAVHGTEEPSVTRVYQPINKLRHGIDRWTMPRVRECVCDAGRLKVELNAGPSDIVHKACCGVDLSRGSDAQEETGTAQAGFDSIGFKNRLAEPDDVWSPVAIEGCAIAVALPNAGLAGLGVANLHEFAMHMDNVRTAGTLVQIVDVLRDDGDIRRPHCFESGKRRVSRVRCDVLRLQFGTAFIVKSVHEFRVAIKGARRGYILDTVPLPQAAVTTKGCQPATSADASPSEDCDRWSVPTKLAEHFDGRVSRLHMTRE
jgi:hypothetical protein